MKKIKKNDDMYTMPMMPMMPMQPMQPRQPRQPMQPMQPTQPIPMQPMPTQPRYPRTPNGDDVIIVEPDAPVDLEPEYGPPVFSPAYLQGFLRSQIGKFMRVDFLMGTGTFIDNEGILVRVGIDHIVLRETKTDSLITADLYYIKFVEIPR